MHIKDFFDLNLLERLLKDWSAATGLATIAVDNNGNYISGQIGFTEFCMKYTRGSSEGSRRCVKCDNECKDTYVCHAGLMDFSIDIKIGDNYLGKIIGGQVLPNEPNEEKFSNLAVELGINPDKYIAALRKVPIKKEESIRAASSLLGNMVNMLVNIEYMKSKDDSIIDVLNSEVGKSSSLIKDINEKSHALDKIDERQRILALNASIEAARAGEYAKGFSVVANEVGKLASASGKINQSIKISLKELTSVIDRMERANSSETQ